MKNAGKSKVRNDEIQQLRDALDVVANVAL